MRKKNKEKRNLRWEKRRKSKSGWRMEKRSYGKEKKGNERQKNDRSISGDKTRKRITVKDFFQAMEIRCDKNVIITLFVKDYK